MSEARTKQLKQLLGQGVTIARAHPIATALVAGVVVCLVLYFGSRLATGIREWRENARVEKLQKQADKNMSDAQKSLGEADQAAGDRQAEDTRRELVIEPARRQASENSNQARQRTTQAEGEYEKARNGPIDDSIDERTLHQRNCADLHQLFPGESIAGCEQ